jgi:hypothetical protein
MHAICPIHSIILDLIIPIILCQDYELWSSSLCNFIHHPVTSSFLGQNFLPAPTQTLSIYDHLSEWDTWFHFLKTQHVKP